MKPSKSSNVLRVCFQKWASTINLVAPSTKADLWQRHIADSAQIFKIAPEPKHWIDLGSGGGFPGIITAILLTESERGPGGSRRKQSQEG